MRKRWLLAAAIALGLAACDEGTTNDAGRDDDGDDGEADASPDDSDGGSDADADGDDDGDADVDVLSPLYGAILFNEVLTDGTAEGDPNGDGDVDPVEDQFVELVSVHSAAVSMAGFSLVEADLPALPRHTFAAGFSLDPGRAVVVFGGGDAPPATSSATFFSANAADPGIPFGLHLTTPADSISLLDADGLLVTQFCYGATGECSTVPASDQSLTRSPDVTGDFVPHTETAGAAGAAFSPGTRVDGTLF